jgi:hypothetical protein
MKKICQHLNIRPFANRNCKWKVARPARFERTTVRLEGGCSIQLSYGRGQQDISRRRARAQARL